MPLMGAVVNGVLLGGLATLGMLAGIWLLNTLALLSKGRELDNAAPRAAGRTWAIVGGVLSFLGLLVVNGFDAVSVFANGVASAPIAATNIVTIVLGVVGISGAISSTAFVVGAASFAGFTVIAKEVTAR